MSDSTDLEWVLDAFGETMRSSRFCVEGDLPALDPKLDVDGPGRIAFPLGQGKAKLLINACNVAPYGKGTKTLVDPKVRRTFELDPKSFRLGVEWAAAIHGLMEPIAADLGLPPGQLEAKIYKLLVYERGGFFLPHRDSEKHDRMVASLIVVLPNDFDGGSLVVRHGPVKRRVKFEQAKARRSPSYAAFYADCEHEVEKVTSGVRVCLAYNLVLKAGPEGEDTTELPTGLAEDLASSIRSWTAEHKAKPLAFALEHHYTERGLSLDLLKGADRALADLVLSAAEKADAVAYLSQVSRHLSQYADDGSDDWGAPSRYARRGRQHGMEIGETYEDELVADQFVDADGESHPFGKIRLQPSAVVSSIPIDDWTPTTEEYEGYTGNAGNTLDRWYHRSAIVVWARDDHFDVVSGGGVDACIPLFSSMVAKIAKTPKARREAARSECLRFARAIIAAWPHSYYRYDSSRASELAGRGVFPRRLLTLKDRGIIAEFLTALPGHDASIDIASVVVDASREFGWDAFAEELKELIKSPVNNYDYSIITSRDVEWLSAYCVDESVDKDKVKLGRALCDLALERVCTAPPQRSGYNSYESASTATAVEASLTPLIEALASCGHKKGLMQLLKHVHESPKRFRLDYCQVPALETLIPWSRNRFGEIPPALATWLSSVRKTLEAAVAKAPMPPSNWKRPVDVTCSCEVCTPLKAFLADPKSEVVRIAAPEDRRQHLESEIRRHQCDVVSQLEKKGRPYSLVLTKTDGSFKRADVRFEADQKLLKRIQALS
ncbi:2OG-Fe(II) oxygenase [Singulisphaera rosea]